MRATRATGLWSGLITILVMAGSDSPATGRPAGGAPSAPLLLSAPELLVEPGRGVELASQILWSDPQRIHLLGILPQSLLVIRPQTGLMDVIAREGPGPWELQGPLVLLSAGPTSDQVLVHQPGRLRSIIFSATEAPRLIRHETPITGSAGDWWLGPVHRDHIAGAPVRVELRSSTTRALVWSAETAGDLEVQISAQYLTRLLRGPGGQLWRVVLGMHGRADLIDPQTGESRQLPVDPREGAWIEATATREGTLFLLTSGGGGSLGRRILRFEPEPLTALEGDRDWNTGAVSPDGSRWVAVDAQDESVWLYDLTTGRSNR